MTTTADAPATPPPSADPPSGSRSTSRWPAALAGTAAAASALGASELVAGLVEPVPSLLYAIGNGVIELGAGTPVKDVAIALFGTNEKTALVIGTVILSLIAGAGLGLLAVRRSIAVASAGFVAFAALGLLATTRNPLDSTAWAVLAAVAAVVVGIAALRFLIGLHQRTLAAAERSGGRAGVLQDSVARGRRDLVRLSLGMAAVAGVAGTFGRSLLTRSESSAVRAALVLPDVAATIPDAPAAASFEDIEGLTPLFTPNTDFYRIDTALMAPVVDVATWTLRIHGMVDQEVELTYDDLLDMALMEADVTIACVSNEVGGDLIGTARWQGVRLDVLLDMAGVDPAASQIVGRSVDGWTAGFPTEVAFDGRDAMLAIAMNGEPLPVEHGFPARLIVPGLYGYVSATKWLQDIELTTWEAFDGYWVPRGWSKEGPVKTQSRIDVPRRGDSLPAGEVVIAGVAWAQQRGVAAVEVQVDDGPWQQAELAEELNIDTWRQWRLRWDAPAGEHTIRVRATDGDGATQTADRVPVAPNGAEGHHTRSVRIA